MGREIVVDWNKRMDIEQSLELMEWLHGQGLIADADQDAPSSRVLCGGVSNKTVLVEWRRKGDQSESENHSESQAWVIKQALAKLRTKADWFSSPERVHREALGLRRLGELIPGGTPRFLLEDHEHHLLVMDAVPEPHENWKTVLLRGEVIRNHVEQFGRMLGAIHRGAQARREELEQEFADSRFFETLRLEPYYGYAAEQVPSASRFLRDLIEETRAEKHTLTHGDYSPKNVLVRQDRLILLDHEVIHWGDPAFDVGFSLTHLLSKAHHLPAYRSEFIQAALWHWESYNDATHETRAVRHTLGCMLARVAGRSPLEYLTDAERRRQADIVVRLMDSPPATIFELTERFSACL